MASNATNADGATVRSFGQQWSRFDQATLTDDELRVSFEEYFRVFPWESLPPDATGADVGCGSGRWAKLVAARIGELHCVDASEDALQIARQNLSQVANVQFHCASVGALPFEESSLDFAYSLGVLHHVPDTAAAIGGIVRALKKDAPLLLYLYYAFDNRSRWYRALWKLSDAFRRVMSWLPAPAKSIACDAVAMFAYWPLARTAKLMNAFGLDVSHFPLSLYRDRSLYTMRTDSRDRFGTPLEKRFRAPEIRQLMTDAGLTDIRFSDSPPYWCVVGVKA